jgi:hypothetical protein
MDIQPIELDGLVAYTVGKHNQARCNNTQQADSLRKGRHYRWFARGIASI